jgi:hypothetical protein
MDGVISDVITVFASILLTNILGKTVPGDKTLATNKRTNKLVML